MSISLIKPRWLSGGALALVGGAAFLASVATPARAGMALPGSAQFGYYDEGETMASGDAEVYTGVGDNILRLINPSGNANRGLGLVTNKCAMIYVFDNDQEMLECCGCPITPTQEITFSFQSNLISNPVGKPSGSGVIAIRAQAINNSSCGSFNFPGRQQLGCNGGCDPTIGPPSSLSSNLLGSITRVQSIEGSPSNVTELSLLDDGPGDAQNNVYLIDECNALIGNGSGAGVCTCPSEELYID